MKRKFVAAKVNINQNIFSNELESLIELIADAIKAKKVLKSSRSKWTWKFTDIKEDKDETKWYITANFVKSRIESKMIVDGDKTDLYKIPKPVAYLSYFFYDVNNEILIFEETGDIQREHFIDAFERIIFQSNLKIGKIEVKLIPKEDSVRDQIMSMEHLTKIEFDLIPPNMIPKDAYKDLGDILNKEKALRLKTVLENEDGLNKDGLMVKSGIEMVQNGYGEVKAYGYSRVKSKRGTRKKQHTFKSKDSIEMVQVERTKSDNITGLLEKFRQRVYNILH
ncbi:hypothetical protein [Ornithinibacillus sp. FSL M8-0202]|uniref:hypothetical protein n=1 Tax=unclassified Ornithinibacillus TaxID=2620869 RepID=UPI0030CCB662